MSTGPDSAGPLRRNADWHPRLQYLAEVDSTNRAVLDEARLGNSAGLALRADHQTSGRGRLGRRWEAPPGAALLMSVLLRPVLSDADLYLCPLVVALAAADACRERTGIAPMLKWPNDLVVGDRKLAGVLAEVDRACRGGRPGAIAVVVGIGMNITWPGPPHADGTCIADELAGRDRVAQLTEAPPTPEGLARAVLDALGERVARLEDPGSRTALAAELERRCTTLGRRVRVDRNAGGPPLTGTAGAITPEGHLTVRADDGEVHVISAGDVVHLRADPAAPGHRRSGEVG